MEIITGVERRRRWPDEEKLRILAELDELGARFNDVARQHDVSRGLLWQWRDAQRRGKLMAEAPGFLLLRIVPELPAPEPQGSVAAAPIAPAEWHAEMANVAMSGAYLAGRTLGLAGRWMVEHLSAGFGRPRA